MGVFFIPKFTGEGRQDERSRGDCDGAYGWRGLGVRRGCGCVGVATLPDEGKQVEREQGETEPGSEPEQIDNGPGPVFSHLLNRGR